MDTRSLGALRAPTSRLSKLVSCSAMLVSLQQQQLEAGGWVWTRPAGWLVGFTPGRCWRPRPSASASASAQTALDQERGRLTSSKQVNIGGGENESYHRATRINQSKWASCAEETLVSLLTWRSENDLKWELFNLHSESFSFVAVEMFQI